MPQDIRKRDDKARAFAEMEKLAELTKAKIKTPDVPIVKIKSPIDKFFENINKYKKINLNDVNKKYY